MPLHPGQVLNGRYRMARLLGEGGDGAVYQAWDQKLDTPCAVKEFLDVSAEAVSQFEREAPRLHTIRHPNLTGVIDHFVLPDQGRYLVMDYVEGEDLATMLESSGKAPAERQVVRWVSQICDALTYLHQREAPIIHGDIKPSNIKITPRGRAVLIIPGIAKNDPDNMTASGFSAPERTAGKLTAAGDVYSLAATAYKLLTNREPPVSEEVLDGSAPAARPVHEVNQDVSQRVSKAIYEAMRVQLDKRTPSAAAFKAAISGEKEVLQDVRQDLGDDALSGIPYQSGKALPARRRMSPTSLVGVLLLLGALVVAAVVVGIYLINQDQAEQQRLLWGTNTAAALANDQARQTNDAIYGTQAAARETVRVATATWAANQAVQELTATLAWLTTAQAQTATQAPLSTQVAQQTASAQATLDWQATASLSSQATAISMEAHYQQALLYIQAGFWQAAWFELQDVIAGDPNYKDVQELLEKVNAQLALDTEEDAGLSYLWRKRNPLLSPEPRRSYSMAYNARRGAVMLFGGYNGASLLGDTWLWSGDLWTQLKKDVAPPARDAAVMVYDSERGVLVLFGGRGVDGALGDTWQFKDEQWELFVPPEDEGVVMPQPRVEACAAYDRTRDEMVLFGGTGPDGFFNNTWTFDGEAWTMHEAQLDGPSSRVGCGMAYDQRRRVVVMFGGNNSGALNETWEWDGESWTQASSAASPSPRAYHAILYHANLNRILVVGGSAGGCSLLKDTWAWDGVNWVELDVGYPGTHGYIRADYDARRNAVMIFGGLSTDQGACQDSQLTWELLLR